MKVERLFLIVSSSKDLIKSTTVCKRHPVIYENVTVGIRRWPIVFTIMFHHVRPPPRIFTRNAFTSGTRPHLVNFRLEIGS